MRRYTVPHYFPGEPFSDYVVRMAEAFEAWVNETYTPLPDRDPIMDAMPDWAWAEWVQEQGIGE